MGNQFTTKWLIDGIDRLGKSSLIKGILDVYGYHLVIHYDKPKSLESLRTAAQAMIGDSGENGCFNKDVENLAQKMYQQACNESMFALLKTEVSIIFDRTHLGEMVYSPLYRRYSGEYVYTLEEDLILSKPYTENSDIRLILLTTSNFDMLVDDGLSFDPKNKKREQDLFVDAFNRSKLSNKVIIDVHDGNGNYKPYDQVLAEALFSSPK